MTAITVSKAAQLSNVSTRTLGWMLQYLGFETLGAGNPGKRGIDNKVPVAVLPRIYIACQLRASGVKVAIAGEIAQRAVIDEAGNWSSFYNCVSFAGCLLGADGQE